MFTKTFKGLTTGLVAFAIILTVFAPAMTARAVTSVFTVTVNKSAYLQDNLSLKTLKDGGSAWDNYAYVTPTSFSGTGTIYVKSINYNNNSICTDEMSLGSVSSLNKTKSTNYGTTAPANEYYFMQARFGASSSGTSLTVTGRYTP